MKDVSERKIINQFVGVKSKLFLIKHIDGKKSNTTKGVNITTEFNEFKDALFTRKIVRHNMRRIQIKKHELGTCEINKIP